MEETLHNILTQMKSNLEMCLYGKSDEIDLLLTCLIAKGHVLLEDVPGTGKTVLIKALSKSIDGNFRRIQCNPDLLPTDITGVSIFHPKYETFEFRPGPVMTNILLIDEINRATTKTQSALLEAMEEKSVTVDGESYVLPRPFMLLATQNPIDFDGTYALPEAQLDRFMMRFSLGYPDEMTEIRMVQSQKHGHPLEQLGTVASTDHILQMQEGLQSIHLDPAVTEYIVRIIRSTRQHSLITLGSSPRATLAFVEAVKAYAWICGRDYVIPDDVKFLAPYILCHRIILKTQARLDGNTAETVLQSIIQQIKAPVQLAK